VKHNGTITIDGKETNQYTVQRIIILQWETTVIIAKTVAIGVSFLLKILLGKHGSHTGHGTEHTVFRPSKVNEFYQVGKNRNVY
jgi:hypothetical protein